MSVLELKVAKAFVKKPSVGKGVGLLMLALAMFTGLDTTIKYLGTTYPAPMLMWFRYATALVFMSVWLVPTQGKKIITSLNWPVQITRGLVLAGSTLCFFAGLRVIALAEASAIASIAPILMTFLAVKFLGEKAPRGSYLALIVSSIGVLFIVRPGSSVFTWAVLLPLLSATFYAIYQLLTRRVAHHDSPYASWFISALVAFLVTCLVAPFFWTTPKVEHLGLLCLTGLFGGLGHLCLTRAYQYATASTLAPFIYLQLAMALLAGLFVFGTWPDSIAMVGMTLIVSTGVMLALMRHRESREISQSKDININETAAQRALEESGSHD